MPRLMLFFLLFTVSAWANAMIIFIELPAGGTLTMEVESSDSIQQIKQRIQDLEGIHPDRQRLFFGSTELQNGRTLADYNIQVMSTLQLRLHAVTPNSIPSLNIFSLLLLSSLLASIGLLSKRRLPWK